MIQIKEIHSFDLYEYEDLIPVRYTDAVRLGKLSAYAFYDNTISSETLMGISLENRNTDWVEMVFMNFTEAYRKDPVIADILMEQCQNAKAERRFTGLYMELTDEEERKLYRPGLLMAGMELRDTKSNVFTFHTDAIQNSDILKKSAKDTEAIALSDIDPKDRTEAEMLIRTDPRSIPFPQLVNWQVYDQELSFVLKKDDTVSGMFLCSRIGESVNIDLAYTRSSVMTPALFGHALILSETLLSPDTEILAATVVPQSRNVIGKMIPEAKRDEITEAVFWFHNTKIPSVYTE